MFPEQLVQQRLGAEKHTKDDSATATIYENFTFCNRDKQVVNHMPLCIHLE